MQFIIDNNHYSWDHAKWLKEFHAPDNKKKLRAELFHGVFEEKEFINKFKVIVFAIISDHNSGKAHNPDGNLKPFMREFE